MRRLTIIFFAVILCPALSATAQQKPPSFIGINGGISLSMGNWSKTDYDDAKSGFAGVGPQFSLDGAYFFSNHIGVGGLINYSSYKTKDIDKISAGFLEAFEADQASTTAGRYELWNFMPGLYFNFPVSKVAITARALAGLTHATTPHIAVNLVADDKDDGTMEQEESTANSFGFDIGAGISYPVIPKLAINLRADYFYSNPDFKINNTNRQNNAGRLISEYHQPLTGINISLGIAYCFSKK